MFGTAVCVISNGKTSDDGLGPGEGLGLGDPPLEPPPPPPLHAARVKLVETAINNF